MVYKQPIKLSVAVLTLTKSNCQNLSAIASRTNVDRFCRELDHDKPPDGEWESEEYGDCVDEITEVYVEQHKPAPAFRKLK